MADVIEPISRGALDRSPSDDDTGDDQHRSTPPTKFSHLRRGPLANITSRCIFGTRYFKLNPILNRNHWPCMATVDTRTDHACANRRLTVKTIQPLALIIMSAVAAIGLAGAGGPADAAPPPPPAKNCPTFGWGEGLG